MKSFAPPTRNYGISMGRIRLLRRPTGKSRQSTREVFSGFLQKAFAFYETRRILIHAGRSFKKIVSACSYSNEQALSTAQDLHNVLLLFFVHTNAGHILAGRTLRNSGYGHESAILGDHSAAGRDNLKRFCIGGDYRTGINATQEHR